MPPYNTIRYIINKIAVPPYNTLPLCNTTQYF